VDARAARLTVRRAPSLKQERRSRIGHDRGMYEV